MNPVASLDFDRLTEAIDVELSTILPPLAEDPDVFGFAIFVPEDAGAAFLVYTFVRESNITAKPGSRMEKDQRYSPIEWIPTLPAFRHANTVLEALVEDYEQCKQEMTEEQLGEGHGIFIDMCARSALDAMQRRMKSGSFGSIWYRVLAMTDDEHPVLNQAFRALNTGRALKEAQFMYSDNA